MCTTLRQRGSSPQCDHKAKNWTSLVFSPIQVWKSAVVSDHSPRTADVSSGSSVRDTVITCFEKRSERGERHLTLHMMHDVFVLALNRLSLSGRQNRRLSKPTRATGPSCGQTYCNVL